MEEHILFVDFFVLYVGVLCDLVSALEYMYMYMGQVTELWLSC